MAVPELYAEVSEHKLCDPRVQYEYKISLRCCSDLIVALVYEKRAEKTNGFPELPDDFESNRSVCKLASGISEICVLFLYTIHCMYSLSVEKDESRLRRICVYAILLGVSLWYFLDLYPGMGIIPYKSIFG